MRTVFFKKIGLIIVVLATENIFSVRKQLFKPLDNTQLEQQESLETPLDAADIDIAVFFSKPEAVHAMQKDLNPYIETFLRRFSSDSVAQQFPNYTSDFNSFNKLISFCCDTIGGEYPDIQADAKIDFVKKVVKWGSQGARLFRDLNQDRLVYIALYNNPFERKRQLNRIFDDATCNPSYVELGTLESAIRFYKKHADTLTSADIVEKIKKFELPIRARQRANGIIIQKVVHDVVSRHAENVQEACQRLERQVKDF
jgi:hypothetical protein